MVLTAALPDETMLVRGFEHQTFQCFDCSITERRLAFTGGKPPPAQVTSPVSAVSEPEDRSEPAHPASNQLADAWTRAVERLRNHQAEIRQRAETAKRADWNSKFNRAWEQLAPLRPPGMQNGHANYQRPKDLAAMFARSVRGRLRKTAGISGGPPRVPALALEPSTDAAQEFRRFWDSLAPGGTPLQLPAESPPSNGKADILVPLPKSLSLVPIEAPASARPAARAILLLRGTLAA